MSIVELIAYYASLLILEYVGLPNATAFIEAIVTPLLSGQMENTVQTLTLSAVPASGSFTLTFGANTTIAIQWNDNLPTILEDLNAILSPNIAISATGSLASQSVVITFNNSADLPLMTAASSLLDAGSNPITIVIVGNADLGPLPLQIQNAFQIGTAVGTQLDIIGKYVGVTRNGFGTNGPITLDDSDFTQFIQLAIITNSEGSDLATIQNLLNTYFPGEIFIFDYQDMRIAYNLNSSVGSLDLAELFITEGLLPKPMGVQMGSVIYGPVLTDFFGVRTYDLPLYNVSGYNTYDSYLLDKPMLTYQDALVI